MINEQEEKSNTHKLKNPEGLQEALNQFNQAWSGFVVVLGAEIHSSFEGLRKALEKAESIADLNRAWENDMHELQKLAENIENNRPDFGDIVLKIERADHDGINEMHSKKRRKGKGGKRKWESANKFHS